MGRWTGPCWRLTHTVWDAIQNFGHHTLVWDWSHTSFCHWEGPVSPSVLFCFTSCIIYTSPELKWETTTVQDSSLHGNGSLISSFFSGVGQYRSQLKGRNRSQNNFASKDCLLFLYFNTSLRKPTIALWSLQVLLQKQLCLSFDDHLSRQTREVDGVLAVQRAKHNESDVCTCKARPCVWSNKASGKQGHLIYGRVVGTDSLPSSALCRNGPFILA